MYCMHSVACLLYYGVISNCIIAYVAYLLYYRLGHFCCILMQLFFVSYKFAPSVPDIFSYGLIVLKRSINL
jgi:hypothetical protein